MDKVAFIVAGGSGKRMENSIPKQFLLLKGYPVIMHTINAFKSYDPHISVIVVLPENQISFWNKLCKDHSFYTDVMVKSGGITRFQSVKKNIHFVHDECLVAIHDGVRPLVSQNTIKNCFIEAEKWGNAVPFINIPETMRRITNENSVQVDRSEFCLIQTPQIFKGEIIKTAYTGNYDEHFTDDAGVVEKSGHKIHLVAGNKENIKITYPEDLDIAEALLKSAITD